MAKPKSFKAELNPALQFISIPDDMQNLEAEQNLNNTQGEKAKNSQQGKQNLKNIQNVENVQSLKNLQKNTLNIKNETIPAGYKINPQYIETKSKRVQLLMQPSLYERIKKQADSNDVSVNEYIHSVLYGECERK